MCPNFIIKSNPPRQCNIGRGKRAGRDRRPRRRMLCWILTAIQFWIPTAITLLPRRVDAATNYTYTLVTTVSPADLWLFTPTNGGGGYLTRNIAFSNLVTAIAGNGAFLRNFGNGTFTATNQPVANNPSLLFNINGTNGQIFDVWVNMGGSPPLELTYLDGINANQNGLPINTNDCSLFRIFEADEASGSDRVSIIAEKASSTFFTGGNERLLGLVSIVHPAASSDFGIVNRVMNANNINYGLPLPGLPYGLNLQNTANSSAFTFATNGSITFNRGGNLINSMDSGAATHTLLNFDFNNDRINIGDSSSVDDVVTGKLRFSNGTTIGTSDFVWTPSAIYDTGLVHAQGNVISDANFIGNGYALTNTKTIYVCNGSWAPSASQTRMAPMSGSVGDGSSLQSPLNFFPNAMLWTNLNVCVTSSSAWGSGTNITVTLNYMTAPGLSPGTVSSVSVTLTGAGAICASSGATSVVTPPSAFVALQDSSNVSVGANSKSVATSIEGIQITIP